MPGAARRPVPSDESLSFLPEARRQSNFSIKKNILKSTLEIGGVGEQFLTRSFAALSPSLPEPGQPLWEPAVRVADPGVGSSLSPGGLRSAS